MNILMIDYLTPSSQSKGITRKPYQDKLSYKWKNPQGGPVRRGLPSEHAICSTTLNFKSTKYNDFLRLAFFFLSIQTPHLCLLLVVVLFSWCFPIITNRFPPQSPSQSHSSFPPVPQSLTSPRDMYHKSFPLPHISNSFAHCTYPTAYCQQKPY